MANYNVDIALYIKGGVELDKLNKKLKQTQKLQEEIERLSNGASSANYLRNKLEAEKDFVKFKKETLKANKKITDQEQKLFEITQKRGRAEREFGQEGNRLARQRTAEFLKQQRLLLRMSRQYSEPIGPVASGVNEFRRDKARRQRAQFIASGAPGVPVAGAQQALPAFQERGLQALNNSIKLNESQLRIETALNGQRQRGVRFLEAQSREEKRQLDLGIAGQRSNLIPGVSSGKAVPRTQHSRPIGPKPAGAGRGMAGGGGRGAQNLALGIGFPLLFGGGVGSVAGGALGSVGGMGGQVLGSAIGGIIDNVSKDYVDSTKGDKFRTKLQVLKNILIDNIELSKDLNNFDTSLYIIDKKFVNDMIFNYEAIDNIDNEHKLRMNTIYKEHKKINTLLTSS